MVSPRRLSRRLGLLLVVFLQLGVLGARAVSAQTDAKDGSDGKTLHILAIGITKYQHYESGTPRFAAKDAKDFTSSLEGVARNVFARTTTHLLIDEQATRTAIAQAAEDIIAAARPQDTFVCFYSGLGKTRTLGLKREEQFYLLPTNFNPALGNSELYDKGIASVLLQSWFLRIRARHQFVVLNSSYSGRGFEGFISRVEEDHKFLGSAAPRDYALLFINRTSYELNKQENGLLTYLILEGLRAGAGQGDGIVTVKRLIDYVEQNARAVLRKEGSTATQRLLSRVSDSGIPASYRSGEDFLLGSRASEVQTLSSPLGSQVRPPLVTTTKAVRSNHAIWPTVQPVSVPANIRESRTLQTSAPQDDDTVFILPPECASLSEVRPSTSIHRNGKDHALLFGTDDYDKWTPLNNPIFDARVIAEVLNRRFGFETEVVMNANKKCISQYLAKYQTKKYRDDEQLFIFFAGHGSYKPNYDGFLIAKDSEANNLDPTGDSWIAHALLARFIDSIPCRHIFLVLDSCFGGAMASAVPPAGNQAGTSPVALGDGSGNATPADSDSELIAAIMQFRTRRFLTSGGNEYVSDGAPGSHSPFARKLLSSFEANPQNKSFFTVSEIIPRVKYANPYQPIILYDSWPSDESRSEFFFFQDPP